MPIGLDPVGKPKTNGRLAVGANAIMRATLNLSVCRIKDFPDAFTDYILGDV